MCHCCLFSVYSNLECLLCVHSDRMHTTVSRNHTFYRIISVLQLSYEDVALFDPTIKVKFDLQSELSSVCEVSLDY